MSYPGGNLSDNPSRHTGRNGHRPTTCFIHLRPKDNTCPFTGLVRNRMPWWWRYMESTFLAATDLDMPIENCHGVVHRYQRLCFLRPLKNQNTLLFFVMCYEINRAPNPRGHHQYPSHLCKTALARTPRIDITLNLHVCFQMIIMKDTMFDVLFDVKGGGVIGVFSFSVVMWPTKLRVSIILHHVSITIFISSRLEIAKRKSNCLELMTTAIFFLHAFTSDAFLMDCDY